MFWSKKANEEVKSAPKEAPLGEISLADKSSKTLVEFFRLSPQDVGNLALVETIVRENTQSIVNDFYAHFESMPEIVSFIERSGSSVGRLKNTLGSFLIKVFQPKLTDELFAQYARIGIRHNQIKLPTSWFAGAMLSLSEIVTKYIRQQYPEQQARQIVESVNRYISLMQQVAIQTFIDERDKELDNKEAIERIIDQATKASQNLAAIAQETAASSNEMADMSARIESDSISVSKFSAGVLDIARIGETKVQDTTKAVQMLANQVHNMEKKIGELNESSKKIQGVLDVIKGIAEQTNLLALNAAIEAARAGEHGRGFAVVAEEVRKLAENSSHSVTEIGTILQQSMSSTNETGKAMNEIGETMRQTAKLMEETVANFNNIISSVGESVSKSENIAREIQYLKEASAQIREANEEVVKSAESLSHLVEM